MDIEFWNLFSTEYSENCLGWTHGKAPILPPSGDSWESIWTANPDLLTFNDRQLLYYRGNGVMPLPWRQGEHDRIGVAEVVSLSKDGLELRPLNDGLPIFDVGHEDEFDGTDALDPASVIWQDQVLLYYSAIGKEEDSIGLAVSIDGVTFTKMGPVMSGRAPDVVVVGDRLRMVYQKMDAAGNYKVFAAESEDGFNFEDISDEPVLTPTKGSWDSLSIATVRLHVAEDAIYAIYGGSSYLSDEPDYFGLARTQDLLEWEFHPGNPVFGCGAKGSPDGGAMWFPAIHKTADSYVMLYEGSRGKYSWELSSAICMASIPRKTPESS